ncbi:hypothetical protein QR680_011426 [Steinernema hermaphroditum]|uniref:Uncharacterized protein n=1 Tax=Steinernema hermaphroditum TaxID=289476 RepID=A0AA39I0W9_9BILA|nr:hypothetical protein QR680_011426 [Steinernema hermaphroditum]
MGGESSKFSDLKPPHVLRRHSTRSIRYAEPPAITIGNSKSCQNVAESAVKMRDSLSVPEIGDLATKPEKHNPSSGSNSPARSTSIRRKSTISIKMRQLIQSCFQNPHEVIGRKIAKRASEQRADFQLFFANLPVEQREEFEENIKMLLKKAVANIDFSDEITRLAEEFGAKLVALRAAGFKPEFMTPLADSFITECAYLDNAVHPRHLTLAAFTEFMSMIFSNVRNGYYAQMRRIRRASHSNSFNGKSPTASGSPTNQRFKRLSMDSAAGSGSSPSPAPRTSSISRSISPGGDSLHDECFGFEDGYLRPPTSSFLPVSARSA